MKKAAKKHLPQGKTLFFFFLSALLFVFSLSVVVSSYLNGSDLIRERFVAAALSDFFHKPARFITAEDLETVRAVKLTDTTVSFGGEDIIVGLRKNHSLEVTDTASLLDLDEYYHTVTLKTRLENVEFLALFDHLEYLSVYNCAAVRSLEDVSAFENLYELEYWNEGQNIASLDALKGLSDLRVLTVAHSTLADVDALSALPSILRLNLAGNEIADISALSALTNLRVLSMPQNRVQSLEPLKELTSLQYLDVSDNQVTSLVPLSGLTDLRQLTVSNTKDAEKAENNVISLEPLSGMKKLLFLYCDNNPSVSLMGLDALERLSAASFNACNLKDASAFAGLKKLNYLSVTENELTDVSSLKALSALQYLYVAGNDALDETELKEAFSGVFVDVLSEE